MNRDCYSDQAAWYWQTKESLIENGALHGDVLILGSSVTFHGIDTGTLNSELGESATFSNIALNGLSVQFQALMLRRYLENHPSPDELVLEIRNANVESSSWKSGPAWRFWLKENELIESGAMYWEPGCFFEFCFSRTFASYCYHRSLDNWIFACAREKELLHIYRQRNRNIKSQIVESDGFEQGNFTTELSLSPSPRPRPFRQNESGIYWLERIWHTCEDHKISLTVFLPPVPRSVELDRNNCDYAASVDSLLSKMSARHPEVPMRTFAPNGYDLADFADDHHFSRRGSNRLTGDFVDWWSEQRRNQR